MQVDTELARIMQAAETESKSLKDSFLAVDALLIAMAKSKGDIGKLLRESGVDAAQLAVAVAQPLRPRHPGRYVGIAPLFLQTGWAVSPGSYNHCAGAVS